MISAASPSVGTSNHMAGELFMMLSHVEMVHVHYRGSSPALSDLIGGHVQVMFDTLPGSLGHIQEGTLRALGVTTPRRVDVLPGVPAMNEYFCRDLDAQCLSGMVGRRGKCANEVVETLSTAISSGLADPGLKQRFADLGADRFRLPRRV